MFGSDVAYQLGLQLELLAGTSMWLLHVGQAFSQLNRKFDSHMAAQSSEG